MKKTSIAICIGFLAIWPSCGEKEPTETNGPDPELCGNGVLDHGEDCDGADLGGTTCEDLGYYAGALGCTDECNFDVSGCTGFCGDGLLHEEHGEECDGDDLGGLTCTALGHYGGSLACTADCVLDISDCHYCGDGAVQEEHGEVCDDGVNDGVYGCMPDCSGFAPAYCGDGLIHEGHGEDCDGENLGEITCENLGFFGGVLACTDGCSFDTSGCIAAFSCGDVLVDPRDGKEYDTVAIGGLCWFANNLDIGERVDSDDLQNNPDMIQKYCLYDDPERCEAYGGLYRWPQAMGYATEPGSQGICPEGWHVPTDAEWKDLEIALGMTQEEADSDNWRGAGVGTSLKTGGDSGFEGLLAGGINASGNSFNYPSFGYFWSSSLGTQHRPWRRCLTAGPHYPPDTIGRWDSWPGSYGLSLRCVKELSSVPESTEWALIQPGIFMMGSPDDEPNRVNDELQHEVTLTRPFLIGTTPVTQGQWQELMVNNPSGFHPDNTGWAGRGSEVCLECPVERVNWWDSFAYANALSALEGLEECYTLVGCTGEPGASFRCDEIEVNAPNGNSYLCEGYRLPTEAESEYAQRAGTTTAYHTGPVGEESQEDAMDRAGWHRGNSSEGPAPGSGYRTQPVGLLEPNDWDVYDMHGNVVEMVWDIYGPFPDGPVTDPLGPETGEHRVRRGGSWLSLADDCRAARRRGGRGPDFTIDRMGFRLARTYSEQD